MPFLHACILYIKKFYERNLSFLAMQSFLISHIFPLSRQIDDWFIPFTFIPGMKEQQKTYEHIFPTTIWLREHCFYLRGNANLLLYFFKR